MSQTKPDDLQHLARAVLIMLLPYEGRAALPFEIHRCIACREYWDSLGGVDSIGESLRRCFAIKYGVFGYNFPEELDKLLVKLDSLPPKNMISGDSQILELCAGMDTDSSKVLTTLRRLGESRYSQDVVQR